METVEESIFYNGNLCASWNTLFRCLVWIRREEYCWFFLCLSHPFTICKY